MSCGTIAFVAPSRDMCGWSMHMKVQRVIRHVRSHKKFAKRKQAHVGMCGWSMHSNRSLNAYRRHKQAKKREYGQRVRDIERSVFTPLVLSTNGGMGKETSTFYKRLTDMIAQKRQRPYPMVMG